MIRITGGRFRGRSIKCSSGPGLRPTTAFVRESLFSILGTRLKDARFLDLCAGSGIVGFEALSRGAAFVEAVEKSRREGQMLSKTREELHIPWEQYCIIIQDIRDYLKDVAENPSLQPFDIIFFDAPYAMTNLHALIETCFEKGLVKPDGVLICEHAVKTQPTIKNAVVADTREYGNSALSFFEHPPVEAI